MPDPLSVISLSGSERRALRKFLSKQDLSTEPVIQRLLERLPPAIQPPRPPEPSHPSQSPATSCHPPLQIQPYIPSTVTESRGGASIYNERWDTTRQGTPTTLTTYDIPGTSSQQIIFALSGASRHATGSSTKLKHPRVPYTQSPPPTPTTGGECTRASPVEPPSSSRTPAAAPRKRRRLEEERQADRVGNTVTVKAEVEEEMLGTWADEGEEKGAIIKTEDGLKTEEEAEVCALLST